MYSVFTHQKVEQKCIFLDMDPLLHQKKPMLEEVEGAGPKSDSVNKVDKINGEDLLPETSGTVTDCFTESWLSLDILSLSIQPAGFSVLRKVKYKITLWEKETRSGLFRD
jgi:hypothetical protein